MKFNHPKLVPFDIKERIGKGSTSEVWRVTSKVNHRDFALKIIPKPKPVDLEFVLSVFIERLILSSLEESCFVKLFATFQNKDFFFLLLEFVPNGNLKRFLDSQKQLLSVSNRKALVFQVVLILEKLHSKGIVHQDLKPENLLVDKQGTLKLADFADCHVTHIEGVNDKLHEAFCKLTSVRKQLKSFSTASTLSTNSNESSCLTRNSIGLKRDDNRDSFECELISTRLAGTYQYLSPESMQEEMPHRSRDMWALGVIANQIMNADYLLNGSNEFEIMEKIDKGKYQWKEMPQTWYLFISELTTKKTANRLGCRKATLQENFDEVKQHLFFTTDQSGEEGSLWTPKQDPDVANDVVILTAKAVIPKWWFFRVQICLKLTPNAIQIVDGQQKAIDSIELSKITLCVSTQDNKLCVFVEGKEQRFQFVEGDSLSWIKAIQKVQKRE